MRTAEQLRALSDAVALLEAAGVEVRGVEPHCYDTQVRCSIDVTIDGDVDVASAAEREFLAGVAELTESVREDTVARAETAVDDAPEPATPDDGEPAIVEAEGSVDTPDVAENGHDPDVEDADDGDDDRLGEGYCGVCGSGPHNEHGLQIHHGKAGHDGDPEMVADPPSEPEGTDAVQNGHAGLFDGADASLPDGIDEATLFSVAEHYDTLGEVAEDIEVAYGRAGAILGANGLLDRVAVEADLEGRADGE